MCMIDEARLLAMKRTKLAALRRAAINAEAMLRELIARESPERMLTAQRLRIVELANEITRTNDAIFAMEQKLGIPPAGESGR